MAEPLSPQTARRIAELKSQQQLAGRDATRIAESESYLELTANVRDARNADDAAAKALENSKAPVGSAERAELQAASTAAAERTTQALIVIAPFNKQIRDLNTQIATYEKDIVSTAAVQTTSPAPTLAEQEAEAKEAGAAAAALPTPVPAEPEIISPEEINAQYVPTLETVVVRSSAPEIGEIEDIQLPPDEQQNLAQEFRVPIPEAPPVNKQKEIVEYEEFQSNDPGFESGFPEEQIVVDSSDRYVKTLDLTADPTADSLGDLINQIQSGNRQQNSLPTRNQQMATGSPKDWRFRISLSPSANYLYKDSNPGILRPLQATSGVIYPYTPSITVNYMANYSSSELTHSNYKIHNYKNSAVESINIVGDFTCQDSAEANYVLAVIHFFKSVTKMFYGKDNNPIRGTPPPLVYLTGFGQYQFDMHPVVITSFIHTFPTDVDYVNAYPTNNSSAIGGQNMQPYMPQIAQFISPLDRLRTLGSKIRFGGTSPPPTFINSQNINEVTRVPSKIQIQLTCLPIVTRNSVSNTFSLRKYASGELMRGSVNFGRTGGGIW